MKKWTLLLPVLAVASAFVGCKEDVELNAPYRSDTVIYGILDPVQDTQWVRINRTWLGDGNNLDDANEARLEAITVNLVDNDGLVVDTDETAAKLMEDTWLNHPDLSYKEYHEDIEFEVENVEVIND